MNKFSCGNQDARGRTRHRFGRALVLGLGLVLALGLVGLGQTSTTTALTSDVNPTVYGQTVTFTATVTETMSGNPVTGGTVTFKDGGVPISGAVPVTAGQAQFSTSSLSVGSHSIIAEYSGSAPYDPSTSLPLTHTVNKANTTLTITSDAPDPSVVGQAYTVQWSVAVVAPGSAPLAPTGLVQVDDGNGNTCSAAVGAGHCPLTSTSAGAKTITATYAGDANFNGSSDTEPHTVNKADTTLTLATSPDPSAVGETVTLTADVAAVAPGGGSPTGTVTFKIGTTVLGTGNLVSTGANTSQAVITTPTIPSGTHTITAQYTGSSDYNGSSDTEDHTVTMRNTTTPVFGSSTPLVVGDTVTCTVTVTGTSPGEAPMPTGLVTVSVSPTGQGSPVSWSHTLIAANAGQFTFTYTPSSAATTPHTFTATYAGDSTYSGSNGSFAQAIIKRAADVQLTCNPTTAYILQDVACQVHVEDDTTAGTPAIPTGTVTFSDGGKNGIFTVGGIPDLFDTWTLDGTGNLTVTYTPAAWDAGTTTITATYNGSFVHSAKSTTQLLTVNLRPTQTMVLGSSATLLVNQLHTGGTVDVTDIAGVGTSTPPIGTLAYSSSLPAGYATITPTTGLAPSDTFAYRCHGLDAAAGFDTVRADYTATDGIHANSAGAFGQGVQRRPTETTLSGCASTATGCTCNATVAEKAGNPGDAVAIQGNLAALSPGTTFSGAAPNWVVTTTTDAFIAIVSVSFEPTNKVHLASTALANVNRSDQFPSAGGDGSTGADCDDGCGSGGRNVDAIIMGINAAELALTIVQLGLETFATVLDVIPDVITGGGVFVIVGVTIPISDIVAAVISGAGIAIDIAVTTMTTDLDGDGIPGVVELTLGTSDIMVDTDLDGMGDADEISEAGGWCGGSRRPNPLVPDSDGDGLLDGEEGQYGTSVCVADTDCDTLTDKQEVDTWGCGDPRDHADPLVIDTDGDGLNDNFEFSAYPACASCPYVNDDDSDDDGLQDGYEDRELPYGTITNTIGNSTSQGSGETHFCMWDTDGDGLLDGEEEGLFGQGAVTAVTSTGSVTTIPALDDDSDNDGLSDYEEVNVTQTNPLHWDTDGDGISDTNELIATGGGWPWPKRAFDQESDPLDRDTDDDGLPDAIEYPGTGLGITRGLGGTRDTTCPYVNDDDSDDDGLQDGYEDQNKDGKWILGVDYGLGNITTQGWGETCACNPDSDGDGLQDGEEEALLGRSATPQGVSTVGPAGPPPYTFSPAPGAPLPLTVPALDRDSDNDGLSDYEEVNITGTDPLDADTDNDTLKDADELVAISGTWPKRTFDQVSDPLDINTDDDHLFDPQEFPGSGLNAAGGAAPAGSRDTQCPFVNDDDSDDDGVQDGAVITRTLNAVGLVYTWTHIEGFADLAAAGVQAPGTVRTVVTAAGGEQNEPDTLPNVCDCDSDGDGLYDGDEIAIGTDPGDWDTDDDGRNDWHEVTGGGPIPTDPFDPDTDDDGLLDSAEVFGSNPTNPVNCDTDGDGLCDGGALLRTPYTRSGHASVVLNFRCLTGIGGHPNPLGIGENERGDGARHSDETDPNNPDTDGDAVGDGFERLSFSVSRQSLIPAVDFFGRPITVVYPAANNTKSVCGCMNPLLPDSDGDGLLDGEEDLNHDGHFDFLKSDFDYVHHGPIPGPAYDSPLETNPCDPDTDHDGLTDTQERRGQANPPAFLPFNPTNPLDHDTDNDWILDGPEVAWVCTQLLFMNLDNDGDGLIDEDWFDLVDNDGDGLVDEDDADFYVRFVQVLDPTNRDSDSDGFIDGLDTDPCNTQLIPIVVPVVKTPVDTDGDGFADDDEVAAGTHPLDPKSFPHAFSADLDLDQVSDDRLWLTDVNGDGIADTVTIDIDSNVLIDIRVQIVQPRDVQKGDFDGDGQADDCRYVVAYAFTNRRVVQPRITLTIYDYNCDFVIDRVEVTK